MIPSDLKPRGRTMAEVEPDFHGMPLKEWLEWERRTERAAAEQYVASPAWRKLWEQQAWPKRALATSRDNYGWKSL